MERSGSLSILAERMKEKAEQERIETEKIFTEQLQSLKNSLQASPQNALSTMLDAMLREVMGARQRLSQQYQVLSLAFGRKWIVLTSLGAALCLGMLAGSWALAEAGAWRLESYRNELERLKQNTQAQRDEQAQLGKAVEILNKTYAELWEKTSGVMLLEQNGSRYIIAPTGSESGHSYNGRPAIKLKERIIMNKTELETIALSCLERLDAEAKEARRTQDEKVRNVETRVEDFERQLTRLSASLLSLQPLTDGLNSMLSNGGRR